MLRWSGIIGFMLDNPLLTTVGSLIGVSGSILSYIMVRIPLWLMCSLQTRALKCVAMNRSLPNVLFGGATPVAAPSDYKVEGQITQTNVDDVVEALANADNVILVSSYQLRFCFTLKSAHGTGCRIWHGCGKGPVRDIGNYVFVAGKGRESTLRDSPRRRTHAWPVQRPARRSIGPV
jgi:NAD(P) transhydrogenase beta subunit